MFHSLASRSLGILILSSRSFARLVISCGPAGMFNGNMGVVKTANWVGAFDFIDLYIRLTQISTDRCDNLWAIGVVGMCPESKRRGVIRDRKACG